ncbi:MAG: ABC transporter permease [Acidobacteria bacterium]|nr:ABC transporter permease [Acidobacteriota bacterium]
MMRWIRQWRSWKQDERDLADEIRSHLAMEKAEQEALGRSPADAGRAARRAFGNSVALAEDVREAWGTAAWQRLWQDVRFGLRMLLRTPVWTLVIGGTLAMGIGTSTAIFSMVYSVLLQPLPYAEPARIVVVSPTATKDGEGRFRASAALWRYWKENLTQVELLAMTRPVANFNLTGIGSPERLQGARSTFELPLALGVRPMLGRYFTQEEQLADAKVAVLSHALWKRRFGGEVGVVGTKILLNGESYAVIGVMGPEFAYPDATFEMWAPLYTPPGEFRHGMNHQNLTVGRLRPGTRLAEARLAASALAQRLAQENPESYRSGDQWIGGTVEPLAETLTDSVRGTLVALMAAAGSLLLIGCMNLSVLLIARASGRSREMAMRIALGAEGGRLRRQMLAEMLPLAIVGAASGVLLAWWLLQAMTRWMQSSLPRIESVGLHVPVLVFAVVASLAVVLLACLLPARMASRAELNDVLQRSSRSVAGGNGAREILVTAQVTLAVVLVFGGALLGRSLAALLRVDPGFAQENVLTMHLAVTRAKYPGDPQVADYYARIVAAVKTIPGVLEAGVVNRLPLSGLTQNGGVEFEGRDGGLSSDWRAATPGFFAAMGIPLRQGRGFTDADRSGAPAVGLIDESMGRRVFGNESPIGKRFRRQAPGNAKQDTWVEIVGVVGHVLTDNLERDLRPQVYWPEAQSTQDRGALVIRTAGNPGSYTAAVREQIKSIDSDQPVYEVRSMQEWVERSMRSRSLTTSLGSMFGLASLVLACLGVYGVVSYTAAQRHREFGVRIALGADGVSVRNLVLRQAARLSLGGTAIGLLLCWPVGRMLQTMLFGVTNLDFVAWGLAPGLLVAAALLAALGPARRAAKADPAEALRSE